MSLRKKIFVHINKSFTIFNFYSGKSLTENISQNCIHIYIFFYLNKIWKYLKPVLNFNMILSQYPTFLVTQYKNE